jgi:hypothetical protein
MAAEMAAIPRDEADDRLGSAMDFAHHARADSSETRRRLAAFRVAGVRFTAGDCETYNRQLPSTQYLNPEVISEIYRFEGAGERLTPLLADARVQRHAKVNGEWNKRLGIEPPSGLSGRSCYGFKPAVFQWTLDQLTMEAMGGPSAHGNGCALPSEESSSGGESARNLYAYNLSCLFGTSDRIQRYVDKKVVKRNGNTLNPYNEAAQMTLPKTPGWSISSWGDAILREGPSLATFLRYAQKGEPAPATAAAAAIAFAPKAYHRATEDPSLAALCLSLGLDEDDFDDMLEASSKIRPKRASEMVPNVKVPGESFGLPGYLWHRAEPGDPRILLAGRLVRCCQHIHGAGHAAALHSAKSPNGGCYFLEKAETKEVSAVSWAWRGKEGELCFDSFEAIGPQYRDKFPALVRALRVEMATQAPNIGTVTFGCGGGTPKLPVPVLEGKVAPVPKQFRGYRDSRHQYLVASADKEEDLGIAIALQDSAKLDKNVVSVAK